ncbi:MAG: hypothetical protein J6K72_02420 [Clostridia bacterium]|nr:hypothetical protein [Clostridia bacterium]
MTTVTSNIFRLHLPIEGTVSSLPATIAGTTFHLLPLIVGIVPNLCIKIPVFEIMTMIHQKPTLTAFLFILCAKGVPGAHLPFGQAARLPYGSRHIPIVWSGKVGCA